MEYTPRRKLTREFKLEAVRQTAMSDKPKTVDTTLVEVRIVGLWTDADFANSRKCDAHSRTCETEPAEDSSRPVLIV